MHEGYLREQVVAFVLRVSLPQSDGEDGVTATTSLIHLSSRLKQRHTYTSTTLADTTAAEYCEV